MKKFIALLLALVLLLSVLPAQVLAAGGIVTDAPVTLTIEFQDGDAPIKGGEFSLYKVAEVAETGELTVVDAFSAYAYLTEIRGKTDETDQQWRELAATLEGVVRDKTSGIAADYTGKTLQTENMAFDYLLASLQKGDFDIVIAAMEATDERKEAADFSDPYYTDYPPMILVKKENADQYKTLADFDGKAVGAQTGTTKADIVTNDMPGANLVALQLVTDLVNQLMYDKVDAVVVDGSVANQYVAENDDFVIAEASSELGAAEPYCVAVQKGDPKGLLPGINEAIAKINSENKIEEFIALADSLSGVAEEVSADAPAE